MSRLTRWVHSRGNAAESGFAMMLSLFVMLIIVTVTLVVAALVTSQSKPTLLNQKFVRTVNGAQAGMQNTLAQLRAANDGLLAGDQIKLPCSDPDEDAKYGGGGVTLRVGSPATTLTGLPGYPITGTVSTGGSANSVIGYSVSVVYFDSDPTQYEDQNNPSWWKDNADACPGGIVAGTPLYAFVQSSGTGAQVPGLSTTAGDRTLQGLYQFETTNSFSVGGRIAEYDASGAGQRNLCLDAGANPAVGTQPSLQNCLALGTARQTWQYRTDLTIYYGGDTSLNLCIQNVSGTPKLETCTSAANTPAGSTYPYSTNQQNQEWGFNDNGHLSAALSTGDVTESTGGSCLEPQGATSSTAASAGAALVIVSCDAATTGYTAWNPDPQVGAGSALTYYTGANGQTAPRRAGEQPDQPVRQLRRVRSLPRCHRSEPERGPPDRLPV